MFETIIVGMDGRQGGRDALALARAVAAPDARIVCVSVALSDEHPNRGSNADYDREIVRDAETRLAAAIRSQPDVESEVVLAGSVARGLHRAADHHGASLIVVGSCLRGPFGRMYAGDDTSQTMREAPCAVAIAPPGYTERAARIRTIGIGWDGGDESIAALAVARRVAGDTGARVKAMAVVGFPSMPSEPSRTTIVAEVDPSGTDPAVEELAAVQPTTFTGLAADELVRFADDLDLLIVGSRRQGLIGRTAFGSTSENLSHEMTRPLLVVPRTAQAVAVQG